MAGKSKTAAPLLLLAGIGLFLLIGLQAAYILLNKTESQPTNRKKAAAEEPASTGNVFTDLAQNHPKLKHNLPKIPGKPVKVDVQPFSHNVITGPSTAHVTLTVFSDPSCGPCRQQVEAAMQNLPEEIRVVHKFYPSGTKSLDGGLFRQIAETQGVWSKVAPLLSQTSDNLTFNDWAVMLEQAGIPLKRQRTILESYSTDMTADLQKDINQADAADIRQFPAFVINGYLIDGRVLKLQYLPRYVTRLEDGERIVQSVDY